jgi:hypothetical protein
LRCYRVCPKPVARRCRASYRKKPRSERGLVLGNRPNEWMSHPLRASDRNQRARDALGRSRPPISPSPCSAGYPGRSRANGYALVVFGFGTIARCSQLIRHSSRLQRTTRTPKSGRAAAREPRPASPLSGALRCPASATPACVVVRDRTDHGTNSTDALCGRAQGLAAQSAICAA